MKEFTVGKNDAGQRLDKFITKTLPSLPKALMYKYLRLKRIKLNGKKADIAVRLKEGDIIDMYINDEFFAEKEERKWINPGFLTGPYLALYGFGLCILYLLSECEQYIGIDSLPVKRGVLLILMTIAMTAIEYIAGVIFIRGLHVQLWDYSDKKFYFQGIICPKFAFYWGVLGAIYYLLIHPHISHLYLLVTAEFRQYQSLISIKCHTDTPGIHKQ